MASQNQDRLAAYFTSHPPTDHPSRWDNLWKAGDFLPWDRGCANPALIDLLLHPSTTIPDTPDAVASESASFILDAPTTLEGKRKRVLVPGCGKGYDVALFAAAGYDAYGLEVSEKATEVAKTWLGSEEARQGKEGEYKARDESVGRGRTEVLQGDFFEDEWVEGKTGFDVIYDNTVSTGWDEVRVKGTSSLIVVPICASAFAARAMGEAHGSASCSWRCAHLPRVPNTQARILWGPSMGLTFCHIPGAVQAARGGDILRRGREGCA